MRTLGPLLCSLALGAGCYTARHANVPLRDNPAGAACYLQCATSTGGVASTACVAACPSARTGGGVCAPGDDPACAQTRRFSMWRTAGVVLLGAAAFVVVSP